MQTEFHHSSIRDELLQIIETFLEQPGQDEANQTLRSIYRKFSKELHLLSLENIVFRPLVQRLTPHYIQSDRQMLGLLKNQLLGVAPYWNTYAFKQNLVELLDTDFARGYQIVSQLVPKIPTHPIRTEASPDKSETNRTLLNTLHILCYQQLQPATLPELVVSYVSHILLTLPNDGSPYFDIDRFSGLPGSSLEATADHLRYIDSFVQKLEGKKVLFVDVHLLPSGFVLNLR